LSLSDCQLNDIGAHFQPRCASQTSTHSAVHSVFVGPSAVAPYFLEEPTHLWTVRGFCDAEFHRDHGNKGDAICKRFKDSTRYIRDDAQVPQIIRSIAATLAATKLSHIKRTWQQCYDDMVAQQSEARLKKRQGAQRNFTKAASLIPALNQQLEGGPFDETVDPDSSDDQDSEKVPFTLVLLDNSSGSEYNSHSDKDQDTTVSTLGAFEKPPEQFVDPDMLALRNFIYTPKVLQDVMSIDNWAAALELWHMEYKCDVNVTELTEIVAFVFYMHAKTTQRQAIARTRRMDPTNPLHAIIENRLRTSVLWSMTTDVPGQHR
ncbi:hypothetical protein BGZ46_002968, partial [Entomortierella lignicola]